MTIDLLEDVAPASNTLGAVTALGQRMFDLEEEIKQLEEKLKQKKQNLNTLAEQELPDLMQELNVRDFTLNNGYNCTIQEITSGSIPSTSAIRKAKGEKRSELETRQQQCFDWLRANNAGDLIKNGVEVQFGRDEDKACNDFTKSLRDGNRPYKRSVGVHYATLNNLIKERLSDNKKVPHDLFKTYTGRKAKLTGGNNVK
tara:strand:- start:5252 stop:5851 length:600 start_codon:yes stop_codon:yes gene_type:complete